MTKMPLPGGRSRGWPRRTCLLFLALACTMAASAQTYQRREIPELMVFGTPARASDAAALDTLLKKYVKTWKAQDTPSFLALHAPDVEWINAYARMFRGTQALGDFLNHRLFPAMNASVSAEEASSMKLISMRYIGADAAVAHLYTDSGRGVSRNAGEDTRRTHIHLVLAKHGEDWRIVHCAIMDAR